MRILLFLILISISTNINARTLIVSNEPNFPADFSDLQACVNAAANGDIILVQGSAKSYGDVEIRKRLIIMGPGYFLGQNPQSQANLINAKLNSIFLLNGSTGSIIQGLEITGNRNIGVGYDIGWAVIGDFGVFVDSTTVMIVSCNVHHNIVIGNSVGSIVRKCFVNDVYCRTEVSNCIIDYSIILTQMAVDHSTVKNCIIAPYWNGGGGWYTNSNFENNIFGHQSHRWAFSISDCIFNNNILIADAFLGTNLGSNAMSNHQDVFIGWALPGGKYSPDGLFQLAPGSPAIGYGTNGIDCGPFGGNDPYKLSGISFHPNIWSVTMPNTATSGEGLKIQIKVNANN